MSKGILSIEMKILKRANPEIWHRFLMRLCRIKKRHKLGNVLR